MDKLTNDQVIDRIAENEIQLIRSNVINYFVDANKGFSISEANNLVPGFSVTRTANLDMMGVSAAHSQFSVDSIVERYGDKLTSIVIDSLKPVNIDAESVGIVIRQIATAIITVVKDESSTGLIFAGYSDNQTFPCLYNIDVSGLFDGCLKHSAIEERVRVDADKSGHVVSFAQTDVIDRLLEGVDPRFVENSGDFIQNHVEIVAKALSEYGKKRRTSRAERSALKSLVEDLAKDAKEQYYKVARDMQNVLRIEFERMIAMMPKVELIELAEALVSITAIERKATSDQGTVGGPIDVAFLTRHEGFVWIKRKHYFSAALNPRYFWRKFGFARREG